MPLRHGVEVAPEEAPARPPRAPAPQLRGVQSVLALQRSAGNAAVCRMLMRVETGTDEEEAPAFDPRKEIDRQLAEGFTIDDLAWASYQVDTDLQQMGPYLDFLRPFVPARQTALARREFDKTGDFGQAAAAVQAIGEMQQQAEARAREQARARQAANQPDFSKQEEEIKELRAAEQKERKKAGKKGGGGRGRKGGGRKGGETAAQKLQAAEKRLEEYRQELEAKAKAAEEEAVEQAREEVVAFTEQGGVGENQRLYELARGDTKLAESLRGPASAVGEHPDADAMLNALAAEGGGATALAPHVADLVSAGVAPLNALPGARLLAKAPGAREWLVANGSRKPEHLAEEIAFLSARPKAVPLAIRALKVLGLDKAQMYAGLLDSPELAGFVLDEISVDTKLRPQLLQVAAKAIETGEAAFVPRAFAQEVDAGKRGLAPDKLLELFALFSAKTVFEVRQALLTGQVPPKAEPEFLDAAQMMPVDKAVTYANQEPIALPPGVTAMGWLAVGNVRYPIAFRTTRYETDSACLKHYEEWGPPNGKFKPVSAPKAKLEAYFADLVAACDEVVGAWSAAGKPNMYRAGGGGQMDRVSPNGKGRWAINVKSDGKSAQVFHADSRYENSYWTDANAR